ncbi:hypothetical protein JW859_12905 [bacterium]|nr:hypothetical protein [bacterium]
MNKVNITWVIAALLVGLLLGCVTTASTQDGPNGQYAPKADSKPVMNMNGHPVYAADVITYQYMRGPLRQLIAYDRLHQIAAQDGVKVDETRFDEMMEMTREQQINSGKTWDQFLSEQSISEKEFINDMRSRLLWDALVESRIDITEEKMQKEWEDNADDIKNKHVQFNHLTESSLATLTYEDCKETIKEKIKAKEAFPVQVELEDEIINSATLDILCLDSAEDKQLFEYLILGMHQKQEDGEPDEAANAAVATLESGEEAVLEETAGEEAVVEDEAAGTEEVTEEPGADAETPADEAEEEAEH